MKDKIALIVGLAFFVLIVLSLATNKEDLKRLQELKNKRRWGGKRLPAHEQEELDRLRRKYWWY